MTYIIITRKIEEDFESPEYAAKLSFSRKIFLFVQFSYLVLRASRDLKSVTGKIFIRKTYGSYI